MMNRTGNDDTIERCPNTNAAGVCMYVGPCLVCASNRAKVAPPVRPQIRLGDVVYVRGFKKGNDRAHVVVAEPREGRVKLSYCGTERWYLAHWWPTEYVITDVSDDNPHVRRARRWLAKIVPDADGWKRIHPGRYGQPGATETVGHIDVNPPSCSECNDEGTVSGLSEDGRGFETRLCECPAGQKIRHA